MRFFFITILISILFQGIGSFAQDAQYSQFYAAPLYGNPALTGTTVFGRMILNARNQWKKNANRFDSRAFSTDFNIPKYKIGIGFLVTRDYAGYDLIYNLPGIGPDNKVLRQTNFGIVSSYLIKIDRHWYSRAGMKFSYTIRNYTFDELKFPDQMKEDGKWEIESLNAINDGESTRYPDFVAGGIIYSNYRTSTTHYPKNYWLGVSLHHLTRPDQSLYTGESRLPLKISIQTGAKIPIGSIIMKNKYQTSITPAIIYKRQGKFDQLDLGTYFYFSPFLIGAWYRGLPGKDATSGLNSESFILLFGFKKTGMYGFENSLSIGISYDVPLTPLSSSTSGTKEISLIYEFEVFGFNRKKRPKFKDMVIPCPKL